MLPLITSAISGIAGSLFGNDEADAQPAPAPENNFIVVDPRTEKDKPDVNLPTPQMRPMKVSNKDTDTMYEIIIRFLSNIQSTLYNQLNFEKDTADAIAMNDREEDVEGGLLADIKRKLGIDDAEAEDMKQFGGIALATFGVAAALTAASALDEHFGLSEKLDTLSDAVSSFLSWVSNGFNNIFGGDDDAQPAPTSSGGNVQTSTSSSTFSSFADVPFSVVENAIAEQETGGFTEEQSWNVIAHDRVGRNGNITNIRNLPHPPRPLTSMTLGEVFNYQRNVLRPAYPPGIARSTGVGRFQFESLTLKANAERVYGSDWRRQRFTPEVQSRLAQANYEAARGNNRLLGNQWGVFNPLIEGGSVTIPGASQSSPVMTGTNNTESTGGDMFNLGALREMMGNAASSATAPEITPPARTMSSAAILAERIISPRTNNQQASNVSPSIRSIQNVNGGVLDIVDPNYDNSDISEYLGHFGYG